MFRCFGRKSNKHAAGTGPTLLGKTSPGAGRKSVKDMRKTRQSVVCFAEMQGNLDDEDARAEVFLRQAQDMNELDMEEMAQMGEEEDARPLIAMVAHDNMKPLMATFAKSYKELLKDFRLTGTGTTCAMLREIGLEPEDTVVPSGPLGGDQVLGAMITENEIRAMFFFRDPLSSHAHIADIEALSRLADVYQIYFASNYRTAAAALETLHDRLDALQQAGTMQAARSIRVPEGMSSDLGQTVQENYKKGRANVIANAANAVR